MIWFAAGRDICADLMRARHRIGKFLLRREIDCEGPAVPWTLKCRSWLTSIRFADQASRATLAADLHARDVLIARRGRIDAELAKLALTASCAPAIATPCCLRGIDTLTAFGLCAEPVSLRTTPSAARESFRQRPEGRCRSA